MIYPARYPTMAFFSDGAYLVYSKGDFDAHVKMKREIPRGYEGEATKAAMTEPEFVPAPTDEEVHAEIDAERTKAGKRNKFAQVK